MEKNLPVNEENPGDVGLILGQKDHLEEEIATHSRIFFFLISVFMNLFRLISWFPLNLTTCT